MENQSQPGPREHPATPEQAAPEVRQLVEMMEALARDTRAQTSDYVESMRLQHEIAIRIGRRTTQIIRVSGAMLIVLGTSIFVVVLSLILHMSRLIDRMDTMNDQMTGMRHTFDQVALDVDSLNDKAGVIARQGVELNRRVSRLLDEHSVRNISRTLDNLAAASAGLKDLPKVVAALRKALSDTNLAHLQALLTHLEQTAGEAAPLTVEMRTLVKKLDDLAQQMDKVVASAGEAGDRVNAETLPRAEHLMGEMTATTRNLNHLLETLNRTPQAVLFGNAPPSPGPGESGFITPASHSLVK